jgi:geranylgeranyl diphosphate synthase type 3
MKMMQLYSKDKTDFTKLTEILGLYFQIRDDYCNLRLQEVTTELSALHG